MEILFKNNYVEVVLDKENSVLMTIWKPTTKDMKDEEYKEIVLKMVDLSTEYKPRFIIDDSRNKKFVVSVELQQWIGKHLMTILFNKISEKIAVLESEDVLIQVATQQVMEEHKQKMYDISFFSNKEDAYKWFKE